MDAGAVFVLTRVGSTWTQQAYVKSTNTAAMDQFGASVALAGDGNTLVAGAPHESTTSGGAYVFSRSGTTWTPVTELVAANKEPNDAFGDHVAIATDGKSIAAAAPGEDSNGDPADNSVLDSGAAYTFALAGATWMQSAYLKAANGGVGDKLDYVGIGGTSVIAGAPFEDSAATGIDGDQHSEAAMDSGAAYVFE
jgi:trimeric autotransporter adhesin